MAKITVDNFYNRGMFLIITFSKWSRSSKVDNDLIGVDKEATDVVRSTQSLFTVKDQKVWKELDLMNAKVKTLIRDCRIPSSSFEGIAYIPMTKVTMIDEEIQKVNNEKENFIKKKILPTYEDMKKRFKKEKPKLYKNDKYYPASELIDRFSIKYSWKELRPPEPDDTTPSGLIAQREWVKFKKEIDEMKRSTVQMVGNALIKKLKKLREQNVDNKIHGKTVNNINKFLDRVDDVFVDFIDSKKLKSTLKEIRDQLDVDLGDWKADTDFQKAMVKEIDTIVKDIASNVKKKRRRSIKL